MSSRNKPGRGRVASRRRGGRGRAEGTSSQSGRWPEVQEEGAAAGIRGVEAHEPKEPSSMMRTLSIVAAIAGLLIGTTALGYAQSSTQDRAPSARLRASSTHYGQRMQERGSVPGHPGASGYAPVNACTSAAARRASPAPPVTRPAG